MKMFITHNGKKEYIPISDYKIPDYKLTFDNAIDYSKEILQSLNLESFDYSTIVEYTGVDYQFIAFHNKIVIWLNNWETTHACNNWQSNHLHII